MIMPEIYKETTVEAAKSPHQCCECQATIQPGDSYIRISGLWEGTWCNFKMCVPCRVLHTEIRSEYDYYAEEYPGPGGLREFCKNAEGGNELWEKTHGGVS